MGGPPAAGGFALGAACGPLAEVCSPAFAVAGGVSGFIAGAQQAGRDFDRLAGDNTMQMSHAGRARGGNAVPNSEVRRLYNKYDLNEEGQSYAHEQFTRQNMTIEEIEDIIKEAATHDKFLRNPPPPQQ